MRWSLPRIQRRSCSDDDCGGRPLITSKSRSATLLVYGSRYSPAANRRDQHAAHGCPPFRKDSVLDRPDDEVARASTVCPGLHHFGARAPAGYDVVWWDPSALQLGADPPFGLRRQELISKDVSPGVVAAGERRYLAWRQLREAAVAAGGVR